MQNKGTFIVNKLQKLTRAIQYSAYQHPSLFATIALIKPK